MDTIELYKAIAEMRRLTAEEKSFSFSFMSYNRHRASSTGMVHVAHAQLRPAAKDDDIAFANFKLFYVDLDADGNQNRNCWQPALMYFNHMKIILQ